VAPAVEQTPAARRRARHLGHHTRVHGAGAGAGDDGRARGREVVGGEDVVHGEGRLWRRVGRVGRADYWDRRVRVGGEVRRLLLQARGAVLRRVVQDRRREEGERRRWRRRCRVAAAGRTEVGPEVRRRCGDAAVDASRGPLVAAALDGGRARLAGRLALAALGAGDLSST